MFDLKKMSTSVTTIRRVRYEKDGRVSPHSIRSGPDELKALRARMDALKKEQSDAQKDGDRKE